MPIRVLLVDDSPIALTVLRRILQQSPEIQVVGTVQTATEALALISKQPPDVICTDFFMPNMDGLEFTTRVMAQCPRPILVISASVQDEDTHRIFQLLEAGAVDILPKPRAGIEASDQLLQRALVEKVRVLAGVRVFKRTARKKSPARKTSTALLGLTHRPKIVAIGASTGGPIALQTLLSQLPADFPLPVICVQHISLGFLQGLIDWLSASCKLPIQIAAEGDRPQPGQIYFPPERQHLVLDHRGRFAHSLASPVEGHRPSVTATFTAVAQFYGRKSVGILLTGMGRDGADGMQEIAAAGGLTIAQDEATSVVFGMPKEAIALGAVQQVLPISKIAPALLDALRTTLYVPSAR